jgi:hypothetical protein
MIDYQKLAQDKLKQIAISQKCYTWTPCGKIEEFLKLFDKPDWKVGDTNIFILRAANRVGKTVTGVNIANYLSSPIGNKYLRNVKFFREFRRPNVGRIVTTKNAAETTYPQTIAEWFPAGQYTSHKNAKVYDSIYKFPCKSKFDIFTFERSKDQMESTHLDWVIIDEPMPYKFWTGVQSRLTYGGPIIFLFTALEGSAWIRSEIEKIERINKDVFVKVVTAEDACIEHGVRGHLPHAFIEGKMKSYDEDEQLARLSGGYISLSGMIYKNFEREYHVKSEFIQYWKDCLATGYYNIVNIVDPHPRKMFCIGWYYVFPNGDVVCFGEFPDDTFPSFHKIKSGDMRTEDYADVIKDTEAGFGKKVDVRLMDPNMGHSPNEMGGDSIQKVFSSKGLVYTDPSDSIVNGHQAVKSLLGKPQADQRPQFYIMDWCHNHIFSMENYAWKESKGLDVNEKPETEFDDFADNVRYGALSGFTYYTPSEKREQRKPVWMPNSMRRKK